MTAAVYRNTPSLSVPQSQNTAPILEFNCLYTHDVKKKAKKWQDGFLRYHTFNKRAMVYDMSRNLVGDMHWTGDEAIQEGDDLTLERNGAMVQVGDNTGQVEADLSELRKSTKKVSRPGVSTMSAGAAPNPAARLPTQQQRSGVSYRPSAQLKHRSLNALLGTPNGPIGKAALPQKSPFEERQEIVDLENEEWEDGRPPKRARVDSPAWSVKRTTKATKQGKDKETPLWARTADASKQKKKALPPGQQRLGTMEIVELSDDDASQNSFLPGFSDAALAPSSPRKEKLKDAQKSAPRSSSPGFQIQRVETRDRALDPVVERQRQARQQPPPAREVDTPTKAARKQQEVNAVVEPKVSEQHQTRPASPKPSKLPSSRPGPKLRLAASSHKKKTLVCQDQLTKKPKRLSSTNTDVAAERLLNVVDFEEEPSRKKRKSAQEQLQERLAKIDQKNNSTSLARIVSAKKKTPAPIEITSDLDPSSELEDSDVDPEVRPATTHEDSAMALRRLDEMMLPPAPPHAPTSRTMSPEPEPPAPPPPPKPPKQPERPLRRAISEVQRPSTKSKRPPGAPVRFTPTPTPSPTKKSRETTPIVNKADPAKNPPKSARLQKSKRPLAKSVSLNMTANGTSAVMLSKPFQAPGKPTKLKAPAPPEPQGPWTREAFDLFIWRPPNWDEEKWCVKEGEAPKGVGLPPAGLSGGVSMPFK